MNDKKTLLLEIGTEEVPAHVIPHALKQLKSLATKFLSDSRIKFADINTYGTPRRLALLIKDVAEKQLDLEETKRGPSLKVAVDAAGNFSKAAIGFARCQKISSENLVIRDGYVYAIIHSQGKSTKEILSTLLPEIICNLNFPNNMRWGNLDFKFIRPIRWIVALLDGEIIPFELANIKSGNVSRGHRFLSLGNFEIKKASDYIDVCKENFVIVDPEERREMIITQINQIAEAINGIADIDSELLEEVLYLVEYPTALAGTFETKYLRLPTEVVITPMRDHQRYFPVKNVSGDLMPFFITVRNGGKDYCEIVQHGNERVLKARLEDAQFFFNEDRKRSLAEHCEKLKTVVFQDGLGSVFEKTERLTKIAEKISDTIDDKISDVFRNNLVRAAKLSKADLVTNMVIEFTELQGVIGCEYAKLDGENLEVCKAIYEHYKPRFANDTQPKTIIGKILSLADKIDNLVATFSRGLIPTGSQDPFALRRQALGAANLLIETQWSISIRELVELDMDLLKISDKDLRDKIQFEVQKFMKLRLENILSASVRHDVIDAVTEDIDDIYVTILKASAVENFLRIPESMNFIQSFVRVSNIAKKFSNIDFNANLFKTDEESELCHQLIETSKKVQKLVSEKKFSNALEALKNLSEPINLFFDSVMVMDKNLSIRNNRLALLKSIDNLFAMIANFQKIVQV